MNKLWTKIKNWFKPKSLRKLKPAKKLAPKSPPLYQPINHKHYRKLIGKIAKQAIIALLKQNNLLLTQIQQTLKNQ